MTQQQLVRWKLQKMIQGIVSDELIAFVLDVVENGLPDLKAEVKTAKITQRNSINATKIRLDAEILSLE